MGKCAFLCRILEHMPNCMKIYREYWKIHGNSMGHCWVFSNTQWWLRPVMLQPWGLLPELAWVFQWSVVIPVCHKKMQQCISIHNPQANVDSNTSPTRSIFAIQHAYTMTSANKMPNMLATIRRLARQCASLDHSNNTLKKDCPTC